MCFCNYRFIISILVISLQQYSKLEESGDAFDFICAVCDSLPSTSNEAKSSNAQVTFRNNSYLYYLVELFLCLTSID